MKLQVPVAEILTMPEDETIVKNGILLNICRRAQRQAICHMIRNPSELSVFRLTLPSETEPFKRVEYERMLR